MIVNRLDVVGRPSSFSVGNAGGGRKGPKHSKTGTFVPKLCEGRTKGRQSRIDSSLDAAS